MTAPKWSSPVTDAMVERAWAAIVGTDVAGMCFQASIIRADLRTALEAVISPAQPSTSPVTERDIDANPYSADEARVAEFLCERGAGGGPDPIGFILASYAWMVEDRNQLRAGLAKTATREALEEINALISNGDRPTVNERNAFEHFTVLNRLLLNIRDIARRALSSVPSTDRGGK